MTHLSTAKKFITIAALSLAGAFTASADTLWSYQGTVMQPCQCALSGSLTINVRIGEVPCYSFASVVDYLFWWDVQGRYHQHYVSGGQIVHVSDQPIPVKSITINLEEQK